MPKASTSSSRSALRSPAAPRLPAAGAESATANASRSLILDTAARLFRTDGYASVSLRVIATECGMKAGSLYYHFSSKDEIVAEVLRIGVERVAHEVRSAVTALGDRAEPGDAFRTAVRAHLRAMLELQDYTSANLRIFGQVPESIRAAQVEYRDDYENLWSDMLKSMAPRAMSSTEALTLARLFLIGAMNGTLEWFHAGHASVDEVAEHFTRLFLDGFFNARPPRRRALKSPVRLAPAPK